MAAGGARPGTPRGTPSSSASFTTVYAGSPPSSGMTAANAIPASSSGAASRYGATGSGHVGSGAGGIRRISAIPASAGIHRLHIGTVPSWSALYLMPVFPVSTSRRAATAIRPRPTRRTTRPARG
ncbi:hypothetical protein V2I01_01440 [Micromonospora sp. BRA006-A]|nr:hypothetical protein [Micromonospora sp. BRA006-A]